MDTGQKALVRLLCRLDQERAELESMVTVPPDAESEVALALHKIYQQSARVESLIQEYDIADP